MNIPFQARSKSAISDAVAKDVEEPTAKIHSLR